MKLKSNFAIVYLFSILFTCAVAGALYLAYTLGIMSTIIAICMVAFCYFAYLLYVQLNGFRR